ncbi:dihydroorotase [Methanolobus halotolerans]|uniref:Dihydroorotase n=1 Tax=Methanolobus halotolerans TaxID=2052935 RepID=A0A4E0PUG3_9EURY|nr:dihydroorotase [Methanolobus halotolerans]TGC06776.1 dihydroorotase [Methanolobus halotolerans]
MPDILIKNTKVFVDNYLQPAELLIEDGKIIKIARQIDVQRLNEVIDAKGALTLPAGIDVHVHFREPGMVEKEDWYTGSSSAAAGGVTTVIEHPNTLPPTIDKRSFKEKLKLANRKSIIDFGIYGGVTGNIEKLPELWGLGVTAFGEIFMAESTGALNISEETLDEALSVIAELGAMACIHAEDEKIRQECESFLKNDFSPQSHSRARPNLCEAYAVEKALKLAKKNGTQTHFCHISTFEAVGLLRKERYSGNGADSSVKVTSEVTPHHLFLSTRDWDRLGSFGKMNPPLRDRRNPKMLLNALNDGTIDMVSTDHAPHTETEKDIEIKSAPSGVPGVETLLPLMLVAVKRNLIPLGRMIDVTSRNPARIFGLTQHSKGVFAEGFDADLVIVDPSKISKIKGDNLHSKAGWTPFEGMDGIFPDYTLARGDIVWDGEILASKGRGKFLPGKGMFFDEGE